LTAKFWVCKRTPMVVGEALECLGGAGYVEESPLPRYFRESPLNSIWEGSGNVIALDVVRAVSREPQSVQALQDELTLTAGADARLDAAVDCLGKQLAGLGSDQDADARSARRLASLLAVSLQGSLLVRAAQAGDPGSSAVAEAFLGSRLGAEVLAPTPAVFGAAGCGAASRATVQAVLAHCDPNRH
jgi:putative acyl-CoA dehydrogenase